jgi:predicted nucleic acid-binding Zn ribbon protein
MKCPKCGTDALEGAEFCDKCGKRLVKKPRSKFLVPFIAIIVVIILILAILALAPIGTARVIVTVHSDHILNTIHYTVYLNGAERASGNLEAGASFTHDLSVGLGKGIFEKSTVVVLATSTGGGLGSVSDQETVSLGNGESVSITLNV